MNNQIKKITGLAAILVTLVVAFSGSAWAYLDAESDTGSGAIDLHLNKDGSGSLNVGNAIPGDSGKHIYRLENAGRIAGNLDIHIPPVINIPGSRGEFTDGRGDLGSNVEIALFLDIDGNGLWSEGDVVLGTGGTQTGGTLRYDSLNSFGGSSWKAVAKINPGRQLNLVLLWRIPLTAGNEIQGDSVNFDIVFTLEQPR